jgi:hypothetical protein
MLATNTVFPSNSAATPSNQIFHVRIILESPLLAATNRLNYKQSSGSPNNIRQACKLARRKQEG